MHIKSAWAGLVEQNDFHPHDIDINEKRVHKTPIY